MAVRRQAAVGCLPVSLPLGPHALAARRDSGPCGLCRPPRPRTYSPPTASLGWATRVSPERVPPRRLPKVGIDTLSMGGFCSGLRRCRGVRAKFAKAARRSRQVCESGAVLRRDRVHRYEETVILFRGDASAGTGPCPFRGTPPQGGRGTRRRRARGTLTDLMTGYLFRQCERSRRGPPPAHHARCNCPTSCTVGSRTIAGTGIAVPTSTAQPRGSAFLARTRSCKGSRQT